MSTAFASAIPDHNLRTKRASAFIYCSPASLVRVSVMRVLQPPRRVLRCPAEQSSYECLCLSRPEGHILRPATLVRLRKCPTRSFSLFILLSLLLKLARRHVHSFDRVAFQTSLLPLPTTAVVSCLTWTCLVCTKQESA